jgi:hypothetical protein
MSGQTIIFLAIVMVGILMLAGLLTDVARVNSGRAMVRRAAESAASSLLADYSSRLKDSYGIFAISSSDTAELEDRFEDYMASCLSIPTGEDYYKGSTDLFGFRIDSIKVTPVYNLSENSVTKKQILEYMKYRAPGEIVEGFIKKLEAIRDVGKMSNAYKQKVSIDKLLGGMDKSQQKLKKNVDGAAGEIEKFVNAFNIGNSWETAFNEYNSLNDILRSLESQMSTLDSSISSLQAQLDEAKRASKNAGSKDTGTNSGSDEESRSGSSGASLPDSSTGSDNGGSNISEIKSRLESLKNERKSLDSSRTDIKSQLLDQWYKLRNPMTNEFVQANENALNEVKKIAEKGKKAREAIDELEHFLDANFSDEENSLAGEFKAGLLTELDSLKELILEGEKAEEMLRDIEGNKAVLQSITSGMDGIRAREGDLPAGGLPEELLETVREYTGIDYSYSKPEKGEKKDDPRKGKAKELNDVIESSLPEDIGYEAAGIDKECLPSFTKVMTFEPDELDSGYIIDDEDDKARTGSNNEEAAYNGDLKHVGDDADLFDEESRFQENALELISDIGGMVTEMTAGLRDNIYLNEYIMGTFKNSVPELDYDGRTVKDTNLHGDEKDKVDTFYDSEVEYILFGNSSQKMNNIMTKSELLLVRIGLNTLHVYTDPEKKSKARTTAAAIAGIWTGGAGIPIISNLIMCGWGVGEAVIDVKDLTEGRSVPIYKMKGDWRLDIGVPSKDGPKTDKSLYFNYHDYLRLFLLTVGEDKKLNRIEDLIQLNIGKSKGSYDSFRMSDCHTYFRIEAEVSMKYLFITQPFVKKELKTGDGRYVHRVVLYEGY